MIPIFATQASLIMGLLTTSVLSEAGATPRVSPMPGAAVTQGAPVKREPVVCLASGDGYLRAKLAGSIDVRIDWPNNGTRCEGEFRERPPGVRLSFQRIPGAAPNLLLVFGLTGVKEGLPAYEVKTNLTVIVQGTSRVYGTLGDSRCTVDSLTQQPLAAAHSYRIEARGFCTQPAHAVRGKGDVLISTFEFAGPVIYEDQKI